MTLFENIYRVETSRLLGRAYTENGTYFITICTKNRECVFGNIHNDIMGLSEIGNVVAQQWQRTQNIRYYVDLDEWIIMPNHIHGIIRINRNEIIDEITCASRHDITDIIAITDTTVETSRRDVSTMKPNGRHSIMQPKSRLHPDSIGSIIGQFKSICTKQIHGMGYTDFAWQPRFYDRIIRHPRMLNNIRRYILNNPRKWERDRNNPARIIKATITPKSSNAPLSSSISPVHSPIFPVLLR